MRNTVIEEWTDEKGCIHRIETPLMTFLAEHTLEHIVRCKDCKHHSYWCEELETRVPLDGYCWMGEREEDAETN